MSVVARQGSFGFRFFRVRIALRIVASFSCKSARTRFRRKTSAERYRLRESKNHNRHRSTKFYKPPVQDS